MNLPFVAPPEWWDEAACRAPQHEVSKFYPVDGEMAEALALCRTCPSRVPCLSDGLVEEWGIWGGHTASDRRKIVLLMERGQSMMGASASLESRRSHGRR